MAEDSFKLNLNKEEAINLACPGLPPPLVNVITSLYIIHPSRAAVFGCRRAKVTRLAGRPRRQLCFCGPDQMAPGPTARQRFPQCRLTLINHNQQPGLPSTDTPLDLRELITMIKSIHNSPANIRPRGCGAASSVLYAGPGLRL